MKATTCMPRLMRSCRAPSAARPAASVSLLERIRDVVFRLIMLSAVSKAPAQRDRASPAAETAAVAAVHRRDDSSIRSEAVEDCIEFLKRSSAEGDAVVKASSEGDADVTAGEVRPEAFPVM